MPAYDSNRFDPPAPLARVTLRAPNNGQTATDVPMLIDSGSDLTLVPANVIADLGLPVDQSESYQLEGFEGHRSTAESVQLELVFFGGRFRGRFVLISSSYGILGRNVLNHFAILLDGPRLNWELRGAASK